MRLLPNGIKIGNATVIVDIIPKSNPEIRPGGYMNPYYITDHDTGNAGRGADAVMHNRYIHNMASYHPRDTSHVSWHLTVDEKFIYQHIPFDEPAYHCGDGFGVKSGNRTSIGVEKTMNVDGNRAATEENAIALHVYLLKNVIKKTPNNVVPHQHWSGKYCPAVILRRDGSFNPFRKRIQNVFSGTTSTYTPPKKQTGSVTTTKPSSKGVVWVGTNDKGKRVESIYKGSDRLNFYDSPRWTNPSGTFGYGEGWKVDNLYRVDGSLMYRVQNSKGKLYYITASSKYVKVVGGKAKSKPKKSISQMADEVIAGKHPDGHAARRKSLGISQSEYEKVRAEVNRRL